MVSLRGHNDGWPSRELLHVKIGVIWVLLKPLGLLLHALLDLQYGRRLVLILRINQHQAGYNSRLAGTTPLAAEPRGSMKTFFHFLRTKHQRGSHTPLSLSSFFLFLLSNVIAFYQNCEKMKKIYFTDQVKRLWFQLTIIFTSNWRLNLWIWNHDAKN